MFLCLLCTKCTNTRTAEDPARPPDWETHQCFFLNILKNPFNSIRSLHLGKYTSGLNSSTLLHGVVLGTAQTLEIFQTSGNYIIWKDWLKMCTEGTANQSANGFIIFMEGSNGPYALLASMPFNFPTRLAMDI